MRKTDMGPLIVLRDVALAFVLLTRLPLPHLPETAFADQARATWAFPLVGLGVAALAGGMALLGLKMGLPTAAAAGLILAVQILVTGAMHEDGLADTADGLWGGWTREQRLEIMKDSAIGTYGVLALILSVGLRWTALTALLPVAGIAPVIVAACLSRAPLPAIMTVLPPARAAGLSRTVGVPGGVASVIALSFGLGVALWACGLAGLAAAIGTALASIGLALIARIKIGGQTGDILGATQQLSEIASLLILASILAS